MRFAVFFFTVAFLSSCSESDNAVLSGSSLQLDHDSVSGDSYSIGDWDSALGAPAQLINRLPPGTLAYLRIPTLWGLIGTPKGNSLSPALASEANQEQIKELQSALSQEVASVLPESLEPIIETLLNRLRSPLEIAVVSPEQVDPAGIVIVLGGQMEFSTLELFNVFLAEATGQNQDLVLLPDGQNSGAGIMSLSGLTVQYDYDFSSKYLTAVVGQEASRAQLQSVLAWTETPNSMSVRSMEQRIDSAGYGFFIWMDMHQSFPALEPFIESQLSADLNTEAMFGIRSLALGEGVVGEKGRLSLILEGSDSVLFDSTLPAAPKIDFPIVGEPRNLVSIRIPNRGWIESMSSLFVAAEDFPGISEELERGDIGALWSVMSEETGVDIQALLNGLLGFITYVEDQAGRYLVISPESPDAFEPMLLSLMAADAISVRNIEFEGMTIREISYITPQSEDSPDILKRLKSRLYLMRDGTNYFMAQAPQILITINQTQVDNTLSKFLDSAEIEIERSVISYIGSSENTASKNYYNYLNLLQLLGDAAGHEVDILGFPSAQDLKLSRFSNYGVQVNFTEGELAVELIYDTQPLEILAGAGGMATMATVGALAAVALPAYKNYSDRAAFSELVLAVTSRKAAVEIAINTRTVKSLAELDGGAFGIPDDIPATANSHGAAVENGVITMTWKRDSSALDGVTYVLFLEVGEEASRWSEAGTCLEMGLC